jgi:hypothetical protein
VRWTERDWEGEIGVSHWRGGDTGVRQRPKTEKREVKLRVRRRKENDQNGVVL